MPQELFQQLRAIFPEDQHDRHQRSAGDDSRRYGEEKLLGLLGRFLLPAVGNHRAQEEEQGGVPLEGPRQAQRRGRRDPLLVLGKTLAKQRQNDAHQSADDKARDLHRAQRRHTVAQQFGNRLPGKRRGGGKLLGAEHRRDRDQDAEAEHRDDRAGNDAGELRQELLAGVGAEQISALKIGEQIGRRGSRAGGDVGAHQVDVHVARAKDAEDELRHLAHRTDRRGVGFAGHAACDQREEERQEDGHSALPDRHAERHLGHPGQPDQAEELPADEPRGRHLDGFHFAVLLGVRHEQRFQVAEGPQDAPPLQTEGKQARGNHARNAAPEGPAARCRDTRRRR